MTKPVAMVSAIRVRLLRLNPARYITPNVPTSDSGTARLGISVAGMLRRNRKVTITTSPMARINSNCTSSTAARMVVVRSVSMSTSTLAGRVFSSAGRLCLIASATPTTLAPGWRSTSMRMAPSRLAQAER